MHTHTIGYNIYISNSSKALLPFGSQQKISRMQPSIADGRRRASKGGCQTGIRGVLNWERARTAHMGYSKIRPLHFEGSGYRGVSLIPHPPPPPTVYHGIRSKALRPLGSQHL